jgi:catechol 2,3-dioxygenase-like lactoylglutathione lyase family enzyme
MELRNEHIKSRDDDKESSIVGIDHIGINVPDIDVATIFLQKAFGAQVIYESYSKQQPPLDLAGIEDTLNVAKGTKIHACRMIEIGYGPTIELFEVHVNGQREAIRSSDLGLQHFCVYTDEIAGSIGRFASAGGRMLSDPNPILFTLEKGDKNYFCYGVTPWGTSVEFITYPDGMPYEAGTKLRRWKGDKAGS